LTRSVLIIILKVIVCLCHGVSSRKILNVIQDGASTVSEVTAACAAGGDCGACRATIANMIAGHEELDSNCAKKRAACAVSPAAVDAAA
jgi:bacterioferritin-associated ferredoxin